MIRYLPTISFAALSFMALLLLVVEHTRPIELMMPSFEASEYTELLGFSAPRKIDLSSSTPNSSIVFSSIEKSLTQLVSYSSKHLQANSTLLATLETITGSLPANLEAADFSHLELVVERSFPGPQGAVFSTLIMQHYQYHYHPQYFPKNNSTPSLDSPLARQHYYFGDALLDQRSLDKDFSVQLFRHQNQLRLYLNQRKEIRGNQKLSDSEKQQQLKSLEAAYKQRQLSES